MDIISPGIMIMIYVSHSVEGSELHQAPSIRSSGLSDGCVWHVCH